MNFRRIYISRMIEHSVLMGLVFLLITACSTERASNIERGSDINFRQGYPEVRMMAIGLFDDEDLPGVNLHVEIVKGSLIYRSNEGIFKADIDLQVQVTQLIGDQRTVIQNRSIELEVTDDRPEVVDTGDVATYTERIHLLPGVYEIHVGVTDKTSGNRTVRRATATIPNPEGENTDITSVLLLGKNNENDAGFVPVTTYFVPATFDSLKFQFQITRPTDEFETIVRMELFEFNADTSHAREVAGIQHSPGSIAYRGIDYARSELRESTERILTTETGSILIEYVTPVLPRANYRFAVNVESEDSDMPSLFKAREFYLSDSPNFPNVESVRELAEPLVYLMERRDHQRLMAIQDPDSLKREIDRFWLSNIRNVNKARQVIELYYTRVEQANKQFSNFKEGWKTDMGMVFILFGPPLQVENTIDVSVWYYSYMRNDPRTLFRFSRPRVMDQHFPFQHYIVDRQRFYHAVEYDRRRDWLSGNILNIN